MSIDKKGRNKMSKKLEHLKKKWKEEGYIVEGFRNEETYHAFFGVIKFYKKSGSPVNFDEDWLTLMKLCKTQNLCIMPLSEQTRDGMSEVFVIQRKWVDQALERVQEYKDSLKNEYWVIQESPESKDFINGIEALEKEYEDIRSLLLGSITAYNVLGLLKNNVLLDQLDGIASTYNRLYAKSRKLQGHINQALYGDLFFVYQKLLTSAGI